MPRRVTEPAPAGDRRRRPGGSSAPGDQPRAEVRRGPAGRWQTATALCALLAAVLIVSLTWDDGAEPPPDFGSRAEASAGPAEPTGPADSERRTSPAAAGKTGGGSATGADVADPVRLTADRVGISARVVPVGTDAERKVAVPGEPREVGWYRHGPPPGSAEGSAVLVGHVDFRTGDLGQFARLYDVRAGDAVTVAAADGTAVRYRVTARATYDKERLPDELFRRTGEPVLTLITCAPPFDADAGGYRRNLVVTAEPLT